MPQKIGLDVSPLYLGAQPVLRTLAVFVHWMSLSSHLRRTAQESIRDLQTRDKSAGWPIALSGWGTERVGQWGIWLMGYPLLTLSAECRVGAIHCAGTMIL